jgi:hypothetical protein
VPNNETLFRDHVVYGIGKPWNRFIAVDKNGKWFDVVV